MMSSSDVSVGLTRFTWQETTPETPEARTTGPSMECEAGPRPTFLTALSAKSSCHGMLPCSCSALARYSSLPQTPSVHVLALQLAQPVENAWCNEATMLEATRHRQTAYMILYTSSAGGPVMRWLEASIVTQAVYKKPEMREKSVRRKYTRDGVEMRSTRDPGEYLIVQ